MPEIVLRTGLTAGIRVTVFAAAILPLPLTMIVVTNVVCHITCLLKCKKDGMR